MCHGRTRHLRKWQVEGCSGSAGEGLLRLQADDGVEVAEDRGELVGGPRFAAVAPTLAVGGQAGGRLGLASYTEGGCDCCEAWTADELAAILRDFRTVSSLQAEEPLAG